jgi:ATP-dependent Clp protease protease subunit
MKTYTVDKKAENRRLILSNTIDSDNIPPLIEKILEFNFNDDELSSEYKNYNRNDYPIELYISTFGGCAYSGLSLFDIIEASKTPVYTIGTGCVMSMGLIIFLAGHKRFTTNYCTFMYHEATCFLYDKLESIHNDMDHLDRLQKDIIDSIVVKNTNIKRKKLNSVKKLKKEWYITAKEAIDLGIAETLYKKEADL